MNGPQSVFEQTYLGVGKNRLSARVAGNGPPLILLHSLLADSTSFDPVGALLAERHRVVLLDLPGFGGSPAASGKLEAVADRVAEAVRAMDHEQRPILLGNGYGGFVCLLTVMRHPGIASRVVLADCGAAFSEQGRSAFRNMSAAVREKGLEAIAEIAMRRLFAPEFQRDHPQLIENRRKRFLELDPETLHNACAALASLDLRPALPSVTTPVLVVVGEHDEATPPPMSYELAEGLPDARLKVLPGCAHVPQLQDPQLFVAAIEDFLDGRN